MAVAMPHNGKHMHRIGLSVCLRAVPAELAATAHTQTDRLNESEALSLLAWDYEDKMWEEEKEQQ